MYDIDWILNVSSIDLCMIHLLSLCRLYRYNPQYDDYEKSFVLKRAEAEGITKIVCKLRTQNDKAFESVYFLPDEDAIQFRSKIIQDFKESTKRKRGDTS